MKLAVSIFKFFASLHLAIFLLLTLALVFAVGTFVESSYGTEAAKRVVYQSPWLNLLLILLTLNVAAAALDRLPWKKKHIGFVITHAGIILILAGSLVTRAYGVEGQMAIREGETASRIILNKGMLQIFSQDSGHSKTFSIPEKAFSWQGREELTISGIQNTSLPSVSLLRYYPKSSRQEKIEESSNGPAALEVVLESSFMKVNHWLFLDNPGRNQVLLGPAELRFTREPLSGEASSGEKDFLEFQFEKNTLKIPLEEELPKTFPLKGTPYQVTLLRVLRDARVDRGQLIDQSREWNNPACELVLEGGGLRERHTVFSKFPDFPTLHGMKPSEAGVRIFYHRPSQEAGAKNELRFVWQEGELPLYQIRKGTEISSGTVERGREIPTGWMDFKFRVERYYPHAKVKTVFLDEPVHTGEHLSAIEIELELGPERKTLWLGQGENQTVVFDNRTYRVIYGLRTLPVGFHIELRDFRVENYPGTNRPASFESDVIVKDNSRGTLQDLTIRMNQPLNYRGFKVFQSGYQQPPGEPEVSIFTVAKDPGIPIKYTGALVLIGGILTMFYSRRFSNHQSAESSKPEAALGRARPTVVGGV